MSKAEGLQRKEGEKNVVFLHLHLRYLSNKMCYPQGRI